MIDLTANISVAALSVLSARYLEQMGWFQRLPSETKRIVALSIAALIALSLHMVSALLQESDPEGVKAAFSTALAIVLQQVYHALTKPDAQ